MPLVESDAEGETCADADAEREEDAQAEIEVNAVDKAL